MAKKENVVPETDMDIAVGTMDPNAEFSSEKPEEDNKSERQKYELMDGSMGSRAKFIRELFEVKEMTRQEIEEKYGFDYRIIYSATINMKNSRDNGNGGGRKATNVTIYINEAGLPVYRENDKIMIAGEVSDYTEESFKAAIDAGDIQAISRNEWMKAQVAAGVDRKAIATQLGLAYGTVYSVTKSESESTGRNVMITLEDGTSIARTEYIRKLAEEGMEKKDIAKKLEIPYQTVFQALKVPKTAAQSFETAAAAVIKAGEKLFGEKEFEAAKTYLAELISAGYEKEAADKIKEKTETAE